METIVKNQLLVLACTTILAIILIRLYYWIKEYREDAKAWREFEKMIKERDRRLWETLFNDPALKKAIVDMIIRAKERKTK